MLLYACDTCSTLDDLTLVYGITSAQVIKLPYALLCSACKTGHWHNEFERTVYDPEKDIVINRESGIGLS